MMFLLECFIGALLVDASNWRIGSNMLTSIEHIVRYKDVQGIGMWKPTSQI